MFQKIWRQLKSLDKEEAVFSEKCQFSGVCLKSKQDRFKWKHFRRELRSNLAFLIPAYSDRHHTLKPVIDSDSAVADLSQMKLYVAFDIIQSARAPVWANTCIHLTAASVLSVHLTPCWSLFSFFYVFFHFHRRRGGRTDICRHYQQRNDLSLCYLLSHFCCSTLTARSFYPAPRYPTSLSLIIISFFHT